MSDQRYNLRGVSASKEDVHNAIKNIDKGIFPQAFCKIIPDILGGDPEYCNIMHADGAGTKSSLAYMYWKETGDLSVWKGIAQDALIMNIDDLLCVGAVDNILVSSTIGRNFSFPAISSRGAEDISSPFNVIILPNCSVAISSVACPPMRVDRFRSKGVGEPPR